MNLHSVLANMQKERKIPISKTELYDQGITSLEDIPIKAKLFNPTGRGTWYVAAYYPNERIAYGYVSLFGDWNDEWGDFSIDELQGFQGPFGVGIEVDLFFTPCLAKDIITKMS